MSGRAKKAQRRDVDKARAAEPRSAPQADAPLPTLPAHPAALRRGVPWLVVVVLFAGIGASGWWWNAHPTATGSVVSLASLPAPALSPCQYLNVGPQAEYIGSAACAACHTRNHQSYMLTAHSKALADLNPAEEPPDAAFYHQPTGRDYRVHRKDG